jgi:AcrR family transcriptional regulator
MSDTGQNGHFDLENLDNQGHAKNHHLVQLADVDRRAARTRKALHKALITLIRDRDYDAISVQDIADEANVGRSTFYAHFTGKDDLLRNCGGWIRGMLIGHRHHTSTQSDAPRPLFDFSLVMFQHARERLEIHRAMNSGSAGPVLRDVKRQVLTELVREDLATLRHSSIPDREVCVQYLVGAYMSLLEWWLDRGAKESPEQMDAAFRALVFEGLKIDPLDLPQPKLRKPASKKK